MRRRPLPRRPAWVYRRETGHARTRRPDRGNRERSRLIRQPAPSGGSSVQHREKDRRELACPLPRLRRPRACPALRPQGRRAAVARRDDRQHRPRRVRRPDRRKDHASPSRRGLAGVPRRPPRHVEPARQRAAAAHPAGARRSPHGQPPPVRRTGVGQVLEHEIVPPAPFATSTSFSTASCTRPWTTA